MGGAPDKMTGEDGLPIPPYAIYNIGGGTPENLLDYINTLQEELVRAGVLPADFDFEAHKKLVDASYNKEYLGGVYGGIPIFNSEINPDEDK